MNQLLKNDDPFTAETLKEYLAVNERYQRAVFLCYKPNSSTSECFMIKCEYIGVKGNQVDVIAREKLYGDQIPFAPPKKLDDKRTIDISYLYPSKLNEK